MSTWPRISLTTWQWSVTDADDQLLILSTVTLSPLVKREEAILITGGSRASAQSAQTVPQQPLAGLPLELLVTYSWLSTTYQQVQSPFLCQNEI